MADPMCIPRPGDRAQEEQDKAIVAGVKERIRGSGPGASSMSMWEFQACQRQQKREDMRNKGVGL